MSASLAEQLQAVTLAHAGERARVRQQQREGLTGPELELKQRHVLALRAARETLVKLLNDQTPGRARLQHDAMVAAHGAPDLSDPTDHQEFAQ